MNKNSILAVVLSALVMFGYIFYQSKYVAPQIEQTATEQVNKEKIEQESKEESFLTEQTIEDEQVEEKESEFLLETNKMKVKFTNRGGDITSLELTEHKDSKTKELIQMAKNVTQTNRAFSLSLGPNNKQPINDIFIVKEFPVNEKGEKKIAFAKKYKDFTLIKQYTFLDDEYMFKFDVIIDGNPNFKGIGINGNDNKKVAYSLRTSPQIGPYYDPKEDRYENRTFLAHNGSKAKKVLLTDNQYKKYDKDLVWAGITGKYFCQLVVPVKPESIVDVYYSTSKANLQMADAQNIIERMEIIDNRIDDEYFVYVGPRSEKELKKYTSASLNKWEFEGKKLNDAMGTNGFLGWLEAIFKFVMELIYKIIPNWGISIIIMTIILKIVLFPLTLKSSLGTLKMQQIQPKMQAIQAKYKDNPEKLQAETAKLYQEVGYNPLSGCLPMIFQMMALFAMYNLFNNYFEFRGAGFVKGWIEDLSMGDSILSWKKNIPIISGITGNHLRLLPIIYLFSQLFYGKITQMNAGGAAGQNPGMMKFMTYGLPIIFSFMFYNAPSGLLLFWTVSNIIQMGQQLIINNVMAKKRAETDKNKDVLKFPKKKGKK